MVRARMMTFEPLDVTGNVTEDESTRVDVTMHEIWADPASRPRAEPNKCEKHSKKMRWVLVPTEMACPFVLSGSQNQPDFPHAWPQVRGSLNSGAMKVEWGQSCPKCVGLWNAVSSGERWRGLSGALPRSWKQYGIPGVVDFMAPQALVDSLTVDSCKLQGAWNGDHLRIQIRRVFPLRDVFRIGIEVLSKPVPWQGDYMVFDAIGDCKASIWVTEDKGVVRLQASLASTTNSIDNLDISIVASGKGASKIARCVLGTIGFPDTN
jgi:hypothetical protein